MANLENTMYPSTIICLMVHGLKMPMTAVPQFLLALILTLQDLALIQDLILVGMVAVTEDHPMGMATVTVSDN